MWLGFGVLCVVVIGGDALLGEDSSTPKYTYPQLIELPLHLALPYNNHFISEHCVGIGYRQSRFSGYWEFLGSLISYNFIAARNGSIWSDYLGAVISVGFIVAGYGTNVGHELTHRIKDRMAMLEGRWLLSASCNADFAIEHVYGHHVTVGTYDDPATALKGENVYKFFVKSTVLGTHQCVAA
jgi:alkane 1-monooxygenase